MKRIILATVVAVGLAGCSSLGSLLEKANGGVGGLFVTQAVVRYIDAEKTEEAKYARALRVKSVAGQVREAAGNGEVSVAALKAFVESKLPADMKVADRLLALDLIAVAAEALEGRVGSGALSPEQLVEVDKLLQRVEFAASYFPAPG